MPLGKLVMLIFLALSLAELVTFALVVSAIGVFNAIFALLATSVLGLFLLARAGRNALERMTLALTRQDPAAIRTSPSAALSVLGGVLLALPGFITDAIGLLLLIPWIQRGVAGALAKRTAQTDVIDLKHGEWQRVPEKRIAGDDDTR